MIDSALGKIEMNPIGLVRRASPDENDRDKSLVSQIVLVEGRNDGSFREVSPLLLHLVIVASAMVLVGGRPLRQRMLREGRIPEWATFPEDRIGDLLANILLHGISSGGSR